MKSQIANLNPSEWTFPGGIAFFDLELCVAETRLRRQILQGEGLGSPDKDSWLQFCQIGKRTYFYAEIDNADNDGTPVTVIDMDDMRFEDPRVRFPSIAAVIDAMTLLLRDGHWIDQNGWWLPQAVPGMEWL